MNLDQLREESRLRKAKVVEVKADPEPESEEKYDVDEWDILLPALDLLNDLGKYLDQLIKRKVGSRMTTAMQSEMAGWATEIENLLADSETLFDEGDQV